MPDLLHPDRLLPADSTTRAIARTLYESVKELPIISPHGHTDAAWFADNKPFANPTELLITPDHYVYRMLYSHGISLEQLGICPTGKVLENPPAPEAVWQLFADHYHLFQATPTRLWLDHVFAEIFGFETVLNSNTAAHYFEVIQTQLGTPQFLPRALYEHFGIELPDAESFSNWEQRGSRVAAAQAIQAEPDAECCYARANKIWLTDPDGHRWELWHRTGEYDALGSTKPEVSSIAEQSACCQPSCC